MYKYSSSDRDFNVYLSNCIVITKEMVGQRQHLLSSQDKDEACHLFTEVLDTLEE